MRKILTALFLISVPIVLLSAGDDAIAQKYLATTGRHTDFSPRLFNFVILVGLLAYLLYGPIKNFLKNRSDSIAKSLQEIEESRQKALDAKSKAEDSLTDAKVKAVEFIEDAKKDSELIKKRILDQANEDIASLDKINLEKMDIERKKAIRESVSEVLNDNITSDDIPLDSEKIINIATKEVA